jgi:nucleoside phosphorylase
LVKILIVENEQEKKRLITETILEVPSLQLSQLAFCEDTLSAKRALSRERFHLVILDINLPRRPDQRTESGAGIDVLSYIKNNARANAPLYVVGMTAYEDGFSLASAEFASPLWKLTKFSYTDLSWKEPLKQAVSYLLELDKPPYVNDGRSFHVDLGIFVALEDEELRSILDLDGAWTRIDVPHDHSRYMGGTFREGNRALSVVAVAAPKMGMPAAAATASKLISTFRPRYLAVAGICAGVRGKTDIGDILIGDPIFDWGSGKWIREKEGEKKGELRFRPAPYPWRLDESLRSSVKEFAEDPNNLNDIYSSFGGERPGNKPRVIVEAMASGGSVLQATVLMEEVRDQHKNLIGIEMESYAVFTAAEYAADPRPQCISIKSVCDFGDEDKEDKYHKYAAHTSAQFLRKFALMKFAALDPEADEV